MKALDILPMPKDLKEPTIRDNIKFILEERYYHKDENGVIDESPKEFFWRVASAIAKHDSKNKKSNLELAKTFYNMLVDYDFLPNSPCLMNAGVDKGMLCACFVLGIEDSIEGIMDTLKAASLVQKVGGGVGIDFSKLRPKNAIIKSTGGSSSGPTSFMKIFNEMTEQVKQGGKRRGANLGSLKINHPDVIEFIKVKEKDGILTNFNLSVAITHDFMKAVEDDEMYDLIDPNTKKVVESLKAREVFGLIVDRSWRKGDPGILFIDTINDFNPLLKELGPIETTNPCFSGDTLVAVADGRVEVTFEELAAEGKDVLVHCVNDDNELDIQLMRNPRMTHKQQEIIKIILEDESYVECTPNHKVKINNTIIEAKDLKRGDKFTVLSTDGNTTNVYTYTLNEFECVVSKIIKLNKEVPVYNGTVDKWHNYFVATKNWAFTKSYWINVQNCGESNLYREESCNLGSINVSNIYTEKNKDKSAGTFKEFSDLFKSEYDMFAHSLFPKQYGRIDYCKLYRLIENATRFLDIVVDASYYPLDIIDKAVKANRKIGLGLMGFADLCYKLDIRYGSEESVEFAKHLMQFIESISYLTSIKLGKEKGTFPNENKYDYDILPNGLKDQSIFSDRVNIHSLLKNFKGLRNAVRTIIAPTGTISTIAGCSSGIEPNFGLIYIRKVLNKDGTHTSIKVVNDILLQKIDALNLTEIKEAITSYILDNGTLQGILDQDFVKSEFKDRLKSLEYVFVTAMDVTPKEHLAIQAAFQDYTDNAISKTINLPNSATREDIANIFMEAYKLKCKGITVYRDGSKDSQVLYTTKKDDTSSKPNEEKVIDTEVVKTEVKKKRPDVVNGYTYKMTTGLGTLYVTINELDGLPFEVFATVGKSGSSIMVKAEAIGRMVSLALRHDISIEEIVNQLEGLGGDHTAFSNKGLVLSIPDAIAKILKERYLSKEVVTKNEKQVSLTSPKCPECGNELIFQEGCYKCPSCYFTKCGG